MKPNGIIPDDQWYSMSKEDRIVAVGGRRPTVPINVHTDTRRAIKLLAAALNMSMMDVVRSGVVLLADKYGFGGLLNENNSTRTSTKRARAEDNKSGGETGSDSKPSPDGSPQHVQDMARPRVRSPAP